MATADITLGSFQVNNTGEINMAKIQAWRDEIKLVDKDIATLTDPIKGPIPLAKNALIANQIALAKYQSLGGWAKFGRFFGFGKGGLLWKRKRSFRQKGLRV